MILFSIPVHEEADVVLDQVRNFLHFAPDAQIILHVSRQWLTKEPDVAEKLGKDKRVWVNSRSLWTGHSDGMVLKAHILNFEFARASGIEFEYFCLHASNDMFVRQGVQDYVTSHDAGFFMSRVEDQMLDWWHRDSALGDPALPRMGRALRESGPVLCSQVEGSFCHKSLFSPFADAYRRLAWHELNFPFRMALGEAERGHAILRRMRRMRRLKKFTARRFYPKEEVYPATLIAPQARRCGTPYCYINWKEDLLVTTQDIESIRAGRLRGHEHVYDEIFAVKRVQRRLDDPLRTYIRGLTAEPV